MFTAKAFILAVVLVGNNVQRVGEVVKADTYGVSMQEFSSKEACEKAETDLSKLFFNIQTICYEK